MYTFVLLWLQVFDVQLFATTAVKQMLLFQCCQQILTRSYWPFEMLLKVARLCDECV